jgi:hypothetical protein
MDYNGEKLNIKTDTNVLDEHLTSIFWLEEAAG